MVPAHTDTQPSPQTHGVLQLEQKKFTKNRFFIWAAMSFEVYIGSIAQGLSSATDCCLPNHMEQTRLVARVIYWTRQREKQLYRSTLGYLDALAIKAFYLPVWIWSRISDLQLVVYQIIWGQTRQLDRLKPTLQTILPLSMMPLKHT